MTKFIDATVPIGPSLPVWPNDPPPDMRLIASIADGSACNVTLATMTAHTGTHLDAPCHFVADELGVDSIPLDVLVGPVYVLDIQDRTERVVASDLERVPDCERLVLKTSNTRRRLMHDPVFQRDYCGLSLEAAELAVERGILLIGLDYLSVEAYKDLAQHKVHNLLLGKHVVAVEGLDLSQVAEGWWRLVCLPLLIPGADGSPVRAFFEPLPTP